MGASAKSAIFFNQNHSHLETILISKILISKYNLLIPASTNRETSDRIILNFSQSGNRRASSDVSTRNAVGRGFLSGNQISSSA